MSDIVELIRYTYEHTIDLEQGYDKPRLLVLEFVICHVKQLSRAKSFRNLLEEPGAYARDLSLKMLDLLE